MRKLLTGLLAATALVPSLASAQQWQDPRHQTQHDNRPGPRPGPPTPGQYGHDRGPGNSHYQPQQWNNGHRDDGRYDRHDSDRHDWSRNWHSDQRYDWNRYRTTNRGVYHLPRYYGPSGWHGGYTRFSVGIRLASPLWGRSYWISNPYTYRLPPVYGPYQWVRYYNDALLVDTRTGVVVDTAYGIFW